MPKSEDKYVVKVFNWSRGLSFRNDLLQNPYFKEEKIHLEVKCAELKEELDDVIAELSEVNEKSKRQELELLQFKQGKST